MTTKQREYKLDAKLIRSIEYILPKIKYSAYMQQIKSWLENFEEDEIEIALDFLFYLEYIPFIELQLRLNQQLSSIDKYFGRAKKYLLIPYAEYPKSNDIIMYLITKCPIFKSIKSEKRIDITADIENYIISEEIVLIYVDDFIGSGKSFDKWYKENKMTTKFGQNSKIYDEQAILAAIIMEDGNNFFNYFYPEVKVFAEYRPKVFCKKNSPFNLSGNRLAMRSLCLKYGSNIVTRFQRPRTVFYDPFGYSKSEALVAFDYGTPNNTLPIIWGDHKWKPIFPRAGKSRVQKASEIKNQAAFYLGIMNKLHINFNDDLNITVGEENIRLSARDDYAILVYLILIDKLFSPLQVCQVLGVTIYELDTIVLKASKKKLVTREGKLTRRGVSFIRELKKKSNIYTFREKDELRIRDKNVFIPKTFRKLT